MRYKGFWGMQADPGNMRTVYKKEEKGDIDKYETGNRRITERWKEYAV